MAGSQGLNRSRSWSILRGRGGSKWFGAFLLGMAVLIASLWWAFEHYRVQMEPVPVESVLQVDEGLEAPVEILWDGRGIAHAEANRDGDVWFALGLIHSRDRMGQMLWLRRLAAGRTAEVLGEPGLGADRLARTLGLMRGARAEWERLDGPTRGVLEAYAQGVNLGLRSVREGVPLFGLGGLSPSWPLEPDWQPADSLAIAKLVAWGTSNGIHTEIVLDDMIRTLGGRLTRLFRPTGLVADEAILASLGLPPSGSEALGSAASRPRPGPDLLEAARISGGTAWALAGAYTDSGAPMLVADYLLL
ncbi:MAG: penicillin acylase family protein, partial [Myxococcota bacterium]